jgi:hypothetical protein
VYASIQNQLYNIVHYLFAVTVLFVVYPSFVFKKTDRSTLENFFSGFIRMVFFIILSVYGLAFAKIYEFISINLLMLVLYLYKRLGKDYSAKISGMSLKLNVKLLNYSDRVSQPLDDFKIWFKMQLGYVGTIIRKRQRIVIVLLLAVVFGYAIYIRFFDSFVNAAPPMSDSYVVLGWAKWVSRREPFFYGIYPKGFHIWITMLQKFAFIDYVYIVKYTGPLVSVLISISIYFFVSRVSGSKYTGIISAIFYGVLIQYIPGDWERQAATNSQEFGYIFILPTTYFFYKYMEEDRSEDFISAFLGFTVTALVHPVALAFTALGGGTVMLVALVSNFNKHWKQVVKTIAAGAVSGVIALIPIGVGFAMGKKLDSSSSEFLTATSTAIKSPVLMLTDYIALAALAIIIMNILLGIRKLKKKLMELVAAVISALAFFLYYYAGVLTQSVVIETRFSGLWQLVAPVTIGLGVCSFLSIIKSSYVKEVLEIGVCIGLIAVSIIYIKPQPIIPYKMEYNENVEQYLKIKNMLRPFEWTVVSDMGAADGGYDLVLSSGNHTQLSAFLTIYNPEESGEFLTNQDTGELERTPDIFIYHEKNVFKTNFESLQNRYLKREEYNENLLKWVEKYRQNHSNLSVFYEGENIRIYRIHQEPNREDINKNIWGS